MGRIPIAFAYWIATRNKDKHDNDTDDYAPTLILLLLSSHHPTTSSYTQLTHRDGPTLLQPL